MALVAMAALAPLLWQALVAVLSAGFPSLPCPPDDEENLCALMLDDVWIPVSAFMLDSLLLIYVAACISAKAWRGIGRSAWWALGQAILFVAEIAATTYWYPTLVALTLVTGMTAMAPLAAPRVGHWRR